MAKKRVDPKELIMELDVRAARSTGYGMNQLPNRLDIIVIGCGGNGSYFIPQMMRYIKTVRGRLADQVRPGHRRVRANIDFDVTLIDGDNVEEKNLIRQNFIQPDIGKNKALVLAERYGKAFGVEVGAIDKYLDEEMAKDLIWKGNQIGQIICGCVDNNATRKILHNVIVEQPKASGYLNMNHLFWIDVANEMFDGQLCVGYRSQHFAYRNERHGYNSRQSIYAKEFWNNLLLNARERDNGLPVVSRGLYFPMPCITEVYPQMLEGPKDFDPNDPSCAENAAQVDQAMVTNIMSSTLMFSAFCQTVATFVDPGTTEGDGADQLAMFSDRRPRAYLMHFGHGGRFAVHTNTVANLEKAFVKDNGAEEE